MYLTTNVLGELGQQGQGTSVSSRGGVATHLLIITALYLHQYDSTVATTLHNSCNKHYIGRWLQSHHLTHVHLLAISTGK